MNIPPHTWLEMHYTYVGTFCQSSCVVLLLLYGFKGIHVSNETKNKETTNQKNFEPVQVLEFLGADTDITYFIWYITIYWTILLSAQNKHINIPFFFAMTSQMWLSNLWDKATLFRAPFSALCSVKKRLRYIGQNRCWYNLSVKGHYQLIISPNSCIGQALKRMGKIDKTKTYSIVKRWVIYQYYIIIVI